MMNRGVSASNASASCTSEACPTASCHHTSRPSVMGTSASWSAGVVRLTTRTCSMALSPATAASALSLTGTATPRRNWPSVVTRSLAPGVLHAELQRLGGEAAEHEGMDGADAGHRERDDDGFGDDREVDDHAVALGDAQVQQGVRGLGDFPLQFGVRDVAAVAGLALEVERDLVAAAGRNMAVHAVVGDVELAALEPGDVRAGAGFQVGGHPPVGGVPGLAAVRSGALGRGLPSEPECLCLPEGDGVLYGRVFHERRTGGGAAVTRRLARWRRRALRRPWARSRTIPKSREGSRARHAALLRSPSRSKWFVGVRLPGSPQWKSGQARAGQKKSQVSLQYSIGPGSSTLVFLLKRRNSSVGMVVSRHRGCCGFIDPGLSAARDGHYPLKPRRTVPQNSSIFLRNIRSRRNAPPRFQSFLRQLRRNTAGVRLMYGPR